MRSVQKKSSHFQHNKNGLCDISVTWQLRIVDWNACVNNDDFTVLVSGGGRCC